ncbi:MAG: glycosyltransferase family 39 protein [Candidatus Omnitrophica bacterium]|nr:glycosyltransferase family 39 protein [Candidatus Omnitrophota bacterium]
MNNNSLKKSLLIELWILPVLFILALWVRLYHLGSPSLFDDEISTVLRINHPFFEAIRLLSQSQFPPLHYALVHCWVNIFGVSEWALRFPSAVFSALTVIVIYKLGEELFNKEAGAFSALLLTFSPFALDYAQNAKMYALYWFLTALSFLFFFRFLRNYSRDAYRRYIVVSILSCYTMYTGLLFLVAQSVMFVLMGNKDQWSRWFRGQLLVMACCVPWLVYVYCSWSEPYVWPFIKPFDYFLFLTKGLLYIIGSSNDRLWPVNYFLYVFSIIYLFIDVVLTKGKAFLKQYYFLLMGLVLPVFIYCLVNYYFLHAVMCYRYIGFIQIPLILLVASQINNLGGFLRKILMVVMVLVAMDYTYVYFHDHLRHPHQDWRQTAEELTKKLKKDDLVLYTINANLYQSKGYLQKTHRQMADTFKYYYKGDTRKFVLILLRDCQSDYLIKKGFLHKGVKSIFVLYKAYETPHVNLDGFVLDYQTSNGVVGFLHFRRNNDKVSTARSPSLRSV